MCLENEVLLLLLCCSASEASVLVIKKKSLGKAFRRLWEEGTFIQSLGLFSSKIEVLIFKLL